MDRKREPKFQVNDKVKIKGEDGVGNITEILWFGRRGIGFELKSDEYDTYFYKIEIGDTIKDVIETDIIAKVE